MAAQTGSSEQVATQVAANTGTSGGSAGNTTTGGSGAGASGPIASSTPVVAPRGYRQALQLMLQGWQEVVPGDSTMLSSAGSLNQAGVLAKLQGYLGVYTNLDTATTDVKQARAQAQSQLPEVRAYHAALKAAVVSYLGEKSPQLVKFGLKPRKTPAPLTSTQLAVRAAKVQANRFVDELPEQMIGDKAYDSDALDARLAKRGIELIAPNRANRRRRTQDGRQLRRYVRRWRVERFFAWLHNSRRLVNRWERKAQNFLGFLKIACAMMLLRHF